MGVIAVDCGGTNFTVAFADRASRPIDARTVPTPPKAEDLPGMIVEAMRGLPEAEAVGVSVAGLVDHEAGTLLWTPHRPGSAAIAAEVGSATGARVAVDNDANAAALAEATGGAGVGHRMVLMVTVGTGIGAGLVIAGRVERGRGFLGEVGHVPVDPRGPVCACGRTGCWEMVASGRALDAAAGEAGLPDGPALMAAASAGSAEARALVDRVAGAFGRGLATLVSVLDPDVIVVGGGVSTAGDLFLSPARQALAAAGSPAEPRRPTPVVAAAFGPSAGIVGAALMAGAPL
jgi:glucokinase